MLLTPQTTVPQVNVALLNEAVDESDHRQAGGSPVPAPGSPSRMS